MAPLTPTKSFFRKLRTLLKSDKASELQLLTTKIVGGEKNKICCPRASEEIRDFRCWFIHKHLFHHPLKPLSSPCPMVSLHPLCQGKGEVRAQQNRATVPASP